MEKDLIIGAFNNFEFEVLKPWIYSIKETKFDGDIVLIAIDAKENLVRDIVNAGVKVIPAHNLKNMRIHMLRFLYIFDYLKDTYQNYRYVISTDVRDVIFQKNPFEKLHHHLSPGFVDFIIAQSESILIKDEEWNRDNILKNFGPYFYDSVKDNEVFNVGVLAGHSKYIKDLCFALFQMSMNRPDWVADQAAYNMLLSFEPWNSITLKTGLIDAWALNAHVTNKPDLLDKYGPFLLEPRPYMENGIVKNHRGVPFSIVHQYDRVPEWADFYYRKYGVNITEKTNTGTAPKYFTYKT